MVLYGRLDALFLSTPSARRATPCGLPAPCSAGDFYPRPPRGGRLLLHLHCRELLHISIHALREEGDLLFQRRFHAVKISIHALREEGDLYPRRMRYHTSPISIHALREEGDMAVHYQFPVGEWISIHALREEGDV